MASIRIPEGMTRQELFPNHKLRARGKIDKDGGLHVELEEWASKTKSVHISDFCKKKHISYKQLKREAKENPSLQHALDMAMDAVAKNIRDQWQGDYKMAEFSKMYLPCFDEVIKEQKQELRELVAEKIAGYGSNSGTVIQLVDSSGYKMVDNKE